MPEIRLFTFYRSSATWRVRAALALKNLQYESEFIDLMENQQNEDTFKSVNPMGQVPVLDIFGSTFSQSMAIMEYLEEAFPSQGQALLPKDLKARAKARAIAEIVNSGIQPIQSPHVAAKAGASSSHEWACFWIAKGFDALEGELQETAGSCCVGDELSIADLCLVPQVFNAYRFGLDMSKYPIIDRLYQRLVALEPFQVSHPFKQPDCPVEERI